MATKFCASCGSPLKSGDKFCNSCGEKIEPVTAHSETVSHSAAAVAAAAKPKAIGAAVSAIGSIFGDTALASASAGEISFTQALSAPDDILSGVGLGPLKYLLNGFSRILKCIRDITKDKKRGIVILALSLIWLVLMILPAIGVRTSVLSFLNFLTFAQGGTGGILSALGGIAGKGIFAYFLTSLVLPLAEKRSLGGLGSGLRSLAGSFNFKDKQKLSPTLLGTGLALIAYYFMTGNASLQNSMAGIAAFILSLRAMSNKAGFLRGFLLSFKKKTGASAAFSGIEVTNIMSGWAAGFALGVGLSVLGAGNTVIEVGFVLIVAAVVLRFMAARGEKGAVSGK